MPTYTVIINRTSRIVVEVEADSPERADIEALSAIARGEENVEDSDMTMDHMVDDQGTVYTYNHRGGWTAERQKQKR
jgi:hypothetical protein